MLKHIPRNYEYFKNRMEKHKFSKLLKIISSFSNTSFLVKIKMNFLLIVLIPKFILNQM